VAGWKKKLFSEARGGPPGVAAEKIFMEKYTHIVCWSGVGPLLMSANRAGRSGRLLRKKTSKPEGSWSLWHFGLGGGGGGGGG